MEHEDQIPSQDVSEEAVEPAMYQSRRQAQAEPEPSDPNDTFLTNFNKPSSFFD